MISHSVYMSISLDLINETTICADENRAIDLAFIQKLDDLGKSKKRKS